MERKVGELEKKLEALETEKTEFGEKLDKFRVEHTESEDKLNALQTTLEQVQTKKHDIHNELEQVREEHEAQKKADDAVGSESASQLSDLSAKLDATTADLEAAISEKTALTEKLDQLKSDLKNAIETKSSAETAEAYAEERSAKEAVEIGNLKQQVEELTVSQKKAEENWLFKIIGSTTFYFHYLFTETPVTYHSLA